MPTAREVREREDYRAFYNRVILRLQRQETGPMPRLSLVDGEIIVVNPSDFINTPGFCHNTRCPRMSDCLRSIGNLDAVGIPSNTSSYISSRNGCRFFVPRTTHYINQLKERGINKLHSAWFR